MTGEEWLANFFIAQEDRLDVILRGGIWKHPPRRLDMAQEREHTISVEIIHDTPDAVLVNDGDRQEWLPRSQVDLEGPDPDGLYNLTAPEWILKDRGLI